MASVLLGMWGGVTLEGENGLARVSVGHQLCHLWNCSDIEHHEVGRARGCTGRVAARWLVGAQTPLSAGM